jgi:protein-L-isoaspartate(D-aspartate) O-methyltransferase
MREDFTVKRENMVKLLESEGIHSASILEAMKRTHRHLFVPPFLQHTAYSDRDLALEDQQVILSPYIAALMLEEAGLDKDSKVLEIGTGSGYQTAILAQVCRQVYTIEIVQTLAKQAFQMFQKMRMDNIYAKCGDGYIGWSQESPFDSIIVTAACKNIPQNLIKQLKTKGHMIIPLEELDHTQCLTKITKINARNEYKVKKLQPVNFLSMTGLASY